jgi:hypothetical protein
MPSHFLLLSPPFSDIFSRANEEQCWMENIFPREFLIFNLEWQEDFAGSRTDFKRIKSVFRLRWGGKISEKGFCDGWK